MSLLHSQDLNLCIPHTLQTHIVTDITECRSQSSIQSNLSTNFTYLYVLRCPFERAYFDDRFNQYPSQPREVSYACTDKSIEEVVCFNGFQCFSMAYSIRDILPKRFRGSFFPSGSSCFLDLSESTQKTRPPANCNDHHRHVGGRGCSFATR